jgi:hypothetical protein
MLDKNRSLLSSVKQQLLVQRCVVDSQAERNRNLALRILFNRMDRMPDDNERLKTIKELGEIGALDKTAATGTLVPGGPTPMDSIQELIGRFRGRFQPSLGDRPASNPVKDLGMLLEALEHAARFFSDKAKIERGGEGG